MVYPTEKIIQNFIKKCKKTLYKIFRMKYDKQAIINRDRICRLRQADARRQVEKLVKNLKKMCENRLTKIVAYDSI